MKILRFFGGAFWRLQLLGSFLTLNIFPLAAAVLVNGLMFFTGQGSEIIEDFWSGKFIQDGSGRAGDDQMVWAACITVLWGHMLWRTSRLLCDLPTTKSSTNFLRIQANVSAANFVRQIGPVFLAICAVAPLFSILVIWAWSSVFYVILGRGPDVRILFEYALLTMKFGALLLVVCFVFLYDLFAYLRGAGVSAIRAVELSAAGRSWRTTLFILGVFFTAPALLSLPIHPWMSDLSPRSVHGTESSHGFSLRDISLVVWVSLVIGLVLIFGSVKIVRYWLSLSFSDSPRWSSSWVAGSFLLPQLALSTILVVLLAYDGVGVAQSIGLIPLAIGVGIFWCTLFSLAFIVVPLRLGGPSLAVLPVIFFFASIGRNDNHELMANKLPLKTQQQLWSSPDRVESCIKSENEIAIREFDKHLLNWLRARLPNGSIDSMVNVPLLVLAGSGGGVRAAQFFAHTMVALDEHTEGRFGDHVFAMSTVSGSSLGAAAWIKARRAAYQPVANARTPDFSTSKNLVSEFFKRDYISPVAGTMLTKDALQQLLPFVLPGGDRSRTMEVSWEKGWSDAVDIVRPSAPVEFRRLGMFSELATAGAPDHPAPPFVVFNSTEVHTGRRFLTSTAKLPPEGFPDAYVAIGACSMHGLVDMPLATAAHLSARFTLVSPAASLSGAMDSQAWEAGGWEYRGSAGDSVHDVPWGQVVDGGYFENYGATTARQLSEAIVASFTRLKEKKLISDYVRLVVLGIVVVNDPLDLGNAPLTAVNHVVVEASAGNLAVTHSYERRFQELWPIAGSYDARELLGFFGVKTPLKELKGTARLQNELMAPLSTMLHTRESRGKTAELSFAYYLLSFHRKEENMIWGYADHIRLGRMLRDANLTRYNSSSGVGGPRTPQFRNGESTMPNPGLAWVLSWKSTSGLQEAISSTEPSRYQPELEIERVLSVFKAMCMGNPSCTFPPSIFDLMSKAR